MKSRIAESSMGIAYKVPETLAHAACRGRTYSFNYRLTMSNIEADDFWSYRYDDCVVYKTAKGEIKKEKLEERPYTNTFTYVNEHGSEEIFLACKTAKSFNKAWDVIKGALL